jgi:hypothetical protein
MGGAPASGGAPKFGAGLCCVAAPAPGGGWKCDSFAIIVPPSGLTFGPPKSPAGAAAGGGKPCIGGAPGGGAAAPGVGGRCTSGIFAEPGIGGATPTIVPLSLLGGTPAGRGGMGGPPDPGAAGGAPGSPGCCWLDMSIVPLNFGAAAPFKLKLHFVHVCAASSFFVPQFGQNTEPPRRGKPRGSLPVKITRKQGERLP